MLADTIMIGRKNRTNNQEAVMSDRKVTLAHGAGGRQTAELIEAVFKSHFANPFHSTGYSKSENLLPVLNPLKGHSLFRVQLL